MSYQNQVYVLKLYASPLGIPRSEVLRIAREADAHIARLESVIEARKRPGGYATAFAALVEDGGDAEQLGAEVDAVIARLEARVGELEKALKPFQHPALSRASPNTAATDEDAIYERRFPEGHAALTLGDFRRARALMEGGEE